MLTHGNPLGVSALLSRLKPSAESFTAVSAPEEAPPRLFAQILHQSGQRSAHLNFLVSNPSQGDLDIPALWEYLCYNAGDMGAACVLADLEESSELFETFRKLGFTVYGWESIWKLPSALKARAPEKSCWAAASKTDEQHLRNLYQALVPPLVQAAEAFPNNGTPRLVYKLNNDLLAYVESSSGPEGIYIRPVIHPSVEDIDALLADLLHQFDNVGLPVYLQVRSYQAWLLDALAPFGREASPRFSLLVKHLAVLLKNGVVVSYHKHADHRQAEPTAPIIQGITGSDPSTSVVKQS